MSMHSFPREIESKLEVFERKREEDIAGQRGTWKKKQERERENKKEKKNKN